MRPAAEEIMKALRCSSMVHEEKLDCTGCPYFSHTEEVVEWLEEVPSDFWDTCDCDKIALDAAELIEKLM